MSQAFAEQLSPSQIVLLRGEVFARRRGRLELPSGVKVSSRELGEILANVAFLACAAQGVLELRVRPHRGFLGLRSGRALFAEPQSTSVPWPESTLEAWLIHLAMQLQPEERHRVRTLVYVLLREDSSNPWRQIVNEVQGGLVALGILEPVERRQSKGDMRQRAQVAASVADILTSLPTDRVQELLQTCRRTVPQIWRLLRREVSHGIGYRRKPSEGVREDYYHRF